MHRVIGLTKRVTRVANISHVGGNDSNEKNQMNMKSTLRRAMHDSDYWVIEMDYVDAQGNLSHRVVSPIRFVGSDRFLALCLCREAPRQFQLSHCQNVRLVPAAGVLMPMPMETKTAEPADTPPLLAASDAWQQPCLA